MPRPLTEAAVVTFQVMKGLNAELAGRREARSIWHRRTREQSTVMRAALAEELGWIDHVELRERPDPGPAAGQALVRVGGAGVGPWDVGFLSGGFPGLTLPFVPGQEIAGARVFGVASPANNDYLRGLGATQVFDYHAADWAEQMRAAIPEGIDLLLDGAGGRTRDQAIGVVRDGGRAVFIVLQGPAARLERGITGERSPRTSTGSGWRRCAAWSRPAGCARRSRRCCRWMWPARRWRGSRAGALVARSRCK
jgi:NADPH:quinone reductase-like Zn-dependent oxidoreductase